jgi:23S rRNA pseudouridine1911/1915/1917 synthase
VVPESSEGQRLDLFLSENLPELTRSSIQRLIREGGVLVCRPDEPGNASEPRDNAGSGHASESAEAATCRHVTKPNRRLKPGEQVQVTIPEPRPAAVPPAEIDLHILYEDDHLLVVNKQPGITVHPAAGHYDDTLVNGLLHYLGERNALSDIGGRLRPGIVHRLDKDTSGVMLVAKDNRTHEQLSRDFASRDVHKTYEAIVKGYVRDDEGMIDRPIARSRRHRRKFTVDQAGRPSVTRYRVIDRREETSWLRLHPETGRTHQLRVHLSSIGHPVIGDPLYARKSVPVAYLALVARSIQLTHPATGEQVSFQAPYPGHFVSLAQRLGYLLEQP